MSARYSIENLNIMILHIIIARVELRLNSLAPYVKLDYKRDNN